MLRRTPASAPTPARTRVAAGLLAVLVVVIGASVSLVIKRVAERATQAEIAVSDVVSETRLQDGLEWQAISGRDPKPIEEEIDTSAARARALLERARELGLDESTARSLGRQQAGYHAVVDRELALLDAGDTDAAERLDETEVDPAADQLLADLEATRVQLRERADAFAFWSDLGVVLSVVLSLVLMGLIQRRVRNDRVRREQERASERRYRSLIDGATDLVFVVDRSGRITYLSPSAERALGAAAPDAPGAAGLRLGGSMEPVLHPSDVDAFSALLGAGQDADAQKLDLRLGRGDEDPVTYEVSVRDLTDDPAVGGLVFTGRDVSEARELDQAMAHFVSMVSHELRTPLTSIRGYLEVLGSDDLGPLEAGQRHAMGVIDRNAARLLELVEELLLLSAFDAGSARLHHEPVDVVRTVEHVVQELDPMISGRRVELVLPERADPAVVLGDASQLGRVVTNLLANAIKFTRDGGWVGVEVQQLGGSVRLRVQDTGIGIPADEQDKIFTRFFRSRLAVDAAIQGTGLGLSLCRTIVEAHGGSIDLESQAGLGTTVTVILPAFAELDPRPDQPEVVGRG